MARGSNKQSAPSNYRNYGSTNKHEHEDTKTLDTENSEAIQLPQQQQHLIGILFIILGAFSFSVMFLLVKVMGPDANTFTLVLYRSLVQIIISLITLLHNGQNPLGPPECRFWLVIRGVVGSGAVCAWFFGTQILPLPDAITLQFTTPPFAAVFAVFLVGEKWMPIDMVGTIVCLMGVAFIAHPTWLFGGPAAGGAIIDEDDDTSLVFKALAVMITEAGAAMAGLAYVSVRKIGHRTSAVVMVLYYGALSIPMCILGSGMLQGTWNPFFLDSNYGIRDYFILLLMGFAGYGGQWLTNLGLQYESAATATLATSTQIVWTYVFELAFLHESINSWSLAGTTLILGYMLVVAVIKIGQAKYALDKESEPLLKEIHIAEEQLEV